MRSSSDYELNQDYFPRFADAAEGYHAVAYKDFHEDETNIDEKEYSYWTSSRLYLKNLEEKNHLPENIIMEPRVGCSAYKGILSTTEFTINDDPYDFEKYFQLKDLIDAEDVDEHIEFQEDEVFFKFVETPADTVYAISQALDNDIEFKIPKQFGNILDFHDSNDTQLDKDCTLKSGHKFYRDVLENANLLESNGDPYGRLNYVSDLENVDGRTWVLGKGKAIEEKVSDLDKDNIYTMPSLLASRVLEEET